VSVFVFVGVSCSGPFRRVFRSCVNIRVRVHFVCARVRVRVRVLGLICCPYLFLCRWKRWRRAIRSEQCSHTAYHECQCRDSFSYAVSLHTLLSVCLPVECVFVFVFVVVCACVCVCNRDS